MNRVSSFIAGLFFVIIMYYIVIPINSNRIAYLNEYKNYDSLNNDSIIFDTIYIINYKFKSLRNDYLSKEYFKRNGDTIYRLRKNKISDEDDSITDFIASTHYLPFYHLIFDKRGRIIEEGQWCHAYFEGNYKSYYKNGKLKAEGRLYGGIEIGKWIYYKKNGKIKFIIDYGMSVRDYPRIGDTLWKSK